MNDVAPTPTLDYPFPDAPAPGAVAEVAPGVQWLRMPVPGPLRHINLWLLADDDGWTVVDCGLPSAETKAHWETIFSTALGGRPITRLIVTHFHTDHFGLCAWLCERWRLAPHMTYGEWTTARAVFAPPFPADAEHRMTFYRDNGVDARMLAAIREPSGSFFRNVSAPAAFQRIATDIPIAIGGRDWMPVIGRGHSPEHACLWARDLGVLICGDILLPRISPNIGVWPTEPRQNPLAHYLASLDNFASIDAGTLVLPAHGLPYRGVRTRIAELKAHHAERLDRLVEALVTPQKPTELFGLMFRREIGPDNMTMAMAETLSHLHLLEAGGRIARARGADGVWRFERRHRP